MNKTKAKMIRTLNFHPLKMILSQLFLCVSVGNISLHFQTFILPLIVIIQCEFCLHKESDNNSTQRSDLTIIQSVWNDMKKQNKLRQTKLELWQRLQDASRNLTAKLQYC